MAGYPDPLQRLISELGRLPGIGVRSAERIAMYLLKAERDDALGLSQAIVDIKDKLRSCQCCSNFSEADTCSICADPKRDAGVVLVVESPKDVVAFERLGRYPGVYHVLLGSVSPHEGTGLRHLNVGKLLARVQRGGIREVILGTNPDVEGDGTALVISRELAGSGVKVTRLARGLPSGSTIEYAGTEILAEALEGRRDQAPEEARGGT